MQRLVVRTKAPNSEYEIKIARNGLMGIGQDSRRWLGARARKVALISNPDVFSHYGPKTLKSLQDSGFSVSQWLVGIGERYKSLASVQQFLTFLSEQRLERTDAVVALGGGVIGDLAGFSAAIYLRGIRFVYVPTSLLAQIDASVGGKTGVNLTRGKNLVGAFHQPSGVLTDLETLTTLPPRELVSGFCEMVKQGAVASRKLFQQTAKLLNNINEDPRALTSSQLEELISAHCSFKAAIVSNDERENLDRLDHRSRKILNFGHTTGHAIEAITKYRRYRHGEAVGIGMVVAGELSRNLGLLSSSDAELLLDAVGQCGPIPRCDDLDEAAILDRILNDKKSVAGNIQWVLLERIGRPKIFSGKEIPSRILHLSLREGLRKASKLRSQQ